MNQREFISQFIDASRPKFNPIFFTRDENEIIEKLINVIKSCERNNDCFTIKLHSYRVIEDYDEINRTLYNYYENLTKNKSKNKKRDNQYEFINLNESYVKLLIVTYYIADRNESDYLDVIIAVPRIVDGIYLMINGIMRSTLFQIVDGSTYNNATSNAKTPSITLKITLMALRIARYYYNIQTVDGERMKLAYYFSRIFNKGVGIIKYILAKYGFYGALQFLGIEGCVYITREIPKSVNDMYVFPVGDNEFYICSPKFILDRNILVQSVVATIHSGLVPGLDYETVFTRDYWVRVLGAEFSNSLDKMLQILDPNDSIISDTIDKGYSILDSFENIFDIDTRNSLKLSEEDKSDTYHIIRWIMREFNMLRQKDNLDIGFKKIRFAEYFSAMYAFKLARGIYRISDMGKKVTIQSIRKAIRTDPNFLLQAISKSKMVSYRNMVSDMDSMQALKYTYKGISGLGENSNQSIPDIYRSIHWSHLGRVDLDSSSDGNPGITGTLCPYAPIYDGGFFADYQEPNTWEDEFMATMNDYMEAYNLKQVIIPNTEEALVASEVVASMQQIIKPVLFADQGEFVGLEDMLLYGN